MGPIPASNVWCRPNAKDDTSRGTCLATASSLFHVVFVEDGGLPRPLYFAIPDLDPPDDNDWSKARMTQIRVAAMISSPNIDKATGTINTATLIAPGLGTGVLSLTYNVRNGSAALVRFAVDMDGKPPIILWQAPDLGEFAASGDTGRFDRPSTFLRKAAQPAPLRARAHARYHFVTAEQISRIRPLLPGLMGQQGSLPRNNCLE